MKIKPNTNGLLFSLIIILSLTQIAQAGDMRWYAGNLRYSAYGAKSIIFTPPIAPQLVSSGESNWVSVAADTWIQAGWRYYKGDVSAIKYVEYLDLDGFYEDLEYGYQLWNSMVDYRIEWLSGEWWCSYIDNELKTCRRVHAAPSTMKVSSEIHLNPMNEVDTFFSDIYYRNVAGQWSRFDQHNWIEEFPYIILDKSNPSYFNTYRANTYDIFVPIIRK
jgi:hypothetical protein